MVFWFTIVNTCEGKICCYAVPCPLWRRGGGGLGRRTRNPVVICDLAPSGHGWGEQPPKGVDFKSKNPSCKISLSVLTYQNMFSQLLIMPVGPVRAQRSQYRTNLHQNPFFFLARVLWPKGVNSRPEPTVMGGNAKKLVVNEKRFSLVCSSGLLWKTSGLLWMRTILWYEVR